MSTRWSNTRNRKSSYVASSCGVKKNNVGGGGVRLRWAKKLLCRLQQSDFKREYFRDLYCSSNNRLRERGGEGEAEERPKKVRFLSFFFSAIERGGLIYFPLWIRWILSIRERFREKKLNNWEMIIYNFINKERCICLISRVGRISLFLFFPLSSCGSSMNVQVRVSVKF